MSVHILTSTSVPFTLMMLHDGADGVPFTLMMVHDGADGVHLHS
jgi:hypothetical protein